MRRSQLKRRTELKRKTPLRSRAAKPKAVHAERTAHLGRTKRKRVSKTAAEARHLERIAAMRCCVTGKRPVVVHHLMKAPDKRTRRDHRWVVPLVPLLHNEGGDSIHKLGSEEKFERLWDLGEGYLIAWAKREWERSNADPS